MSHEQITAWALNQLSPEEEARLEAQLQQNPDEQKLAAATKDFCTFLSSELRDESLALTEEQRQMLITPRSDGFQLLPSRIASKPLHWWQRPAVPMALAASLALLGALSVLYLPILTMKNAGRSDLASAEGKEEEMARFKISKAASPADKPLIASIQKDIGGKASPLAAAPESLKPQPQKPDLNIALSTPSALPMTAPQAARASEISIPAVAAVPMPMTASSATFGSAATGTVGGAVSFPGNPMTSSRQEADSFAPPYGDRRSNTESYQTLPENKLISVSREPLSTFSIDVDTASYANVRRFLNQNTRPPREAVRIEELINYFPTDEAGPAADSKQPFAVKAEMAACPWQPQHKLVRVHLKGRDIGSEHKASNLVFLVDVSGSMSSPDKLELVQRSLRMLTERLDESDHVAMVTYAGGTEVVLASTSGEKKADIIAAIDRLQSGGSTHGSAGIKMAYDQAVAGFIKGGVNRVILCTDGDFNVGLSSPQELEELITEKARSGVFLSVLGYGTGNLKDHTMETLADKGNGNYAYIDSVSEARKVLVEQMQGTLITIAKDVKIQVEFNPAVVREYRLIGYENRLLDKEDFNDDTKDAGEIGAGHSVTALYEVVPANLKPGESPALAVDPLKYQPQDLAAPAAATAAPVSNEALTVKLRYKEPEGTTSKLLEVPLKDDERPIEKASAEFKFSAAVAGFGLLLRESSYKGELTWERVRQLAREGKGADPLGYRGEFLQLIEKAQSK